MNLLQIAGGQTWPNFLPILGYRPKLVYFLTSSDPHGKFARALDHLRKAAALAGLEVDFKRVATGSSEPTLKDALKALESIQAAPVDLVNLTGGTKAMSFAAYTFACNRGIPSFHLDTRRRGQPFDDFESAPMTLPFPELEEISRRITVKIALEAQGFPTPAAFKHASAELRAFGREAAAIRRQPVANREISDQLGALRSLLTGGSGSGFLRKGKLRTAVQQPISATEDSAWHRYLTAAAAHGIVQPLDGPGGFLLVSLDPFTASSDELLSHAENRFKLLEGIWFELAVLGHLASKSSFSDIGWSVEAERPNADSLGETDLVAFNATTLNLHFISCKTSGPHSAALDHIQGLRRRATKEGGEFSKAELWIFQPKSEVQRATLERHCQEQNVALKLYSDEITP